MKHSIFVLLGPTAVGKTDLSIEIAEKIDGEIISADSMQIYRYMNVGTAKPTEEEMRGIPHHMISIIDPDVPYNVSLFQHRAKELIKMILSKGRMPMLVGGTGLYINSIINDMDFTQTVSNAKLRAEFKAAVHKYGKEYLYDELKRVDRETADKVHQNDLKRVIRALEVYYYTGRPYSKTGEGFMNPSKEYDPVIAGLIMDREKLYERINRRVDDMIQNGLIDEVKFLISRGYTDKLTSVQGLGYKELFKYFDNEISLEEAIFFIKRNTRRFAKRQLTWFKRDERIKWFNVDEDKPKEYLRDEILLFIREKIRKKNNSL